MKRTFEKFQKQSALQTLTDNWRYIPLHQRKIMRVRVWLFMRRKHTAEALYYAPLFVLRVLYTYQYPAHWV